MIIEIKNYTKQLGDQTVLNNINLTLESGKIYGFWGKNGSGKTMLFRALTTLIYPTSGDITFNGVSIINEDYDLSNIGVLIENPGFFPNLSGYKNLEILYSINHKKNANVIDDILEKVGLKADKDKLYKKYSLGMKQRLGIAQAFMEDQQVILLDEPTNALDKQAILELRTMIMEEKQKGKLILIASHSAEDLQLLCDTVYEMESGHLKGVITL